MSYFVHYPLAQSSRWCVSSYCDRPTFPTPHKHIRYKDNDAFTFQDPDSSCQVITIRGTNATLDWLTNCNFKPDHYTIPGSVLHSGFADAALGLWSGLSNEVHKKFPLWINGHSLGGATGTIIAMMAQIDGYKVERLDTFGAPRPFNKAGANQLRALLPPEKICRVWMGHDIVSRVLLSSLGAWHPCCVPIHLSDGQGIEGVEEWKKEREKEPDTLGRARLFMALVKGAAEKRLGSLEDHSVVGYADALEKLTTLPQTKP